MKFIFKIENFLANIAVILSKTRNQFIEIFDYIFLDMNNER
jgi:hypothetical protein